MIRYLFFFLLIANNVPIYSQTQITEGKIVYNIFVSNMMDEQQGQLIITLKNNMMKREMKMKNGYSNIILFDANTGKSTVYSEMNGNKLSKVISKSDVIAQNQKFIGAKYTEFSKPLTILSKVCNGLDIMYADGSKNSVYYNLDYKIGLKEFYSMFPELNGIPMQYQVSTSGNMILLVANSIEVKPIDNLELEAPQGYKLMK